MGCGVPVHSLMLPERSSLGLEIRKALMLHRIFFTAHDRTFWTWVQIDGWRTGAFLA
jgi:hypothetical protein